MTRERVLTGLTVASELRRHNVGCGRAQRSTVVAASLRGRDRAGCAALWPLSPQRMLVRNVHDNVSFTSEVVAMTHDAAQLKAARRDAGLRPVWYL